MENFLSNHLGKIVYLGFIIIVLIISLSVTTY
jgi:hypothetical protein